VESFTNSSDGQLISIMALRQGHMLITGDSMLPCATTMRLLFLDYLNILHKDSDGHIKGTNDFSEMQGGVTYSWKWGSGRTCKKDNMQWEITITGKVIGGNNPSFVQFRLAYALARLNGLISNYFHGWLNSMVIRQHQIFLR